MGSTGAGESLMTASILERADRKGPGSDEGRSCGGNEGSGDDGWGPDLLRRRWPLVSAVRHLPQSALMTASCVSTAPHTVFLTGLNPETSVRFRIRKVELSAKLMCSSMQHIILQIKNLK